MNLQVANQTPLGVPDPSASLPRPMVPPKPLPIAGQSFPGGISTPPTTGAAASPIPLASSPSAGITAQVQAGGGNSSQASPASSPPASGIPSNPWAAGAPARIGAALPLAAAPAPGAPSPTPLAAGSAQPYANTTPNTPGSSTDYTNQTITPGAGVDRLALAKSNFENFKTSTEPGYQADLRDANTAGYGGGQGGSGMLRGRLGDIGVARTAQLQTAENQNINDATQGSIADNYANIGIAQQQQGFQQGQQQNAFGQGVTQAQLGDQLTNSAFGRAATTTQIGDAGNPSDVGLALSGYYGNQAGQAGQAAGSLVGNSVLANALKKPVNPATGQPY